MLHQAMPSKPITDAEFDLLRTQRLPAHERTLTQAEVDHLDLTRASAVDSAHS